MSSLRGDVRRLPLLAVTGPLFVPFLPTYIPPELCFTVGIDPQAAGAPDVCMDVVRDDVAASGVSARGLEPAAVSELEQVVADAQGQGIDLKIVVIDANPPIDTPLRDIATAVGEDNPGATVLALSPSFAGTSSPQFTRVVLEAGEDLAKTGDAVQSSKNFVGELTESHFPWTPFTIVLVLAVALAVVGTRALQKWSKRHAAPESVATSGD
ncbi:TPM domain-containing protein [Mycobacterium sp. smrl_JER01]